MMTLVFKDPFVKEKKPMTHTYKTFTQNTE